MKVRYVGDENVSDAQVNWGGNDDPRGLLCPDEVYEVLEKDVRTWHTKIRLEAYPGRRFNSVVFVPVEPS